MPSLRDRLAEGLHAPRAWVGASAFRKLFASTIGLSLALATMMTAAGYLTARETIRRSVLSGLDARAEAAALRIELTVGGVLNGVRALARNGIVTNALVDADGREFYVRPLLRDFVAEAPAPLRLQVVDFMGRPIIGDRPGAAEDLGGTDWLAKVVEGARVAGVVRPSPDGPVVVYAQPVSYPGTGRAEGALVARVSLGPVLKARAGDEEQAVVELIDSGAGSPPIGAPDRDLLVAERAVALGPGLDLRLRFGLPRGVAFRGLHRFTAATIIGVGLALAIAFIAVWWLSERATAGVRALSASVVDAALANRTDVRVPAFGRDEYGALGAAFNVLLARLQEASDARLAEQVERRQGAERALRLATEAVEQAAEAIEVVSADGRVAFANGAAARLRGVGRDEAVGLRFEALLGRTPEWWAEQWAHLAAERTLELTARVARRGGSVPVAVSLSLFELDGACHCTATVRDVSDRLRAEASERLASLGTLAAGVAHEINNPLAYVLGNLAFVREAREARGAARAGDEERRALDEAIHGAERVRDVVRALRVYARPGEGPPERVDPGTELRGALRLAANTVQHRARIVELIGQTPPVLARASELGQVFVNLLVNAGQAARADAPGGPEIVLRTFTAPDGRAGIEVSDNGVGIPAEHQPRIFEPFFTTKAVGDGTGLGLSICHGIVTRLGGTIGFESEPGVGTRFTVLLPAAGSPAVPEGDAAAPPLQGRILVVDDDPAVTRALARLLGKSADVAVETEPGRALDRLAGEPRPDAILCDVMMPGLSGPAFHARLLGVDPALARRVVFITGGAVSESIAAAVAASGQPCVEKPPERDALARAIATVRGA